MTSPIVGGGAVVVEVEKLDPQKRTNILLEVAYYLRESFYPTGIPFREFLAEAQLTATDVELPLYFTPEAPVRPLASAINPHPRGDEQSHLVCTGGKPWMVTSYLQTGRTVTPVYAIEALSYNDLLFYMTNEVVGPQLFIQALKAAREFISRTQATLSPLSPRFSTCSEHLARIPWPVHAEEPDAA